MPSAFNFLGHSSSDNRPLSPIERKVRSKLFSFDEDEAMNAVRQQFEPLKSLSLKRRPANLRKLPLTGGWHSLKDGVATPDEPKGDWLVFDCETSQLAPNEWHPLCAVATNGSDWWVWLPEVSGKALETHIPFDIPFIAHNSAYDASFITENPGSLCTMAIAAQLYGAPDYMLHTMKVNRFAPWAKVSLPTFNRLQVLAQFLQIDMHSKDTRNLCVDNVWHINYREHLLEILNYCIADVTVTIQVFAKMWPDFLRRDPNPVSWLGLFEISKFALPFESDFPRWTQATDQAVSDQTDLWIAKIVDRLHEVRAHELKLIQGVEALIPEDLEAIVGLALLPRTRGTKVKKASNVDKFIKNTKSLYKTAIAELEDSVGKISCKNHKYFDSQIMAPSWLFDFSPTPTNKTLPALLGCTWCDTPIVYDHPHFNILDLEGNPCGTWWSSKMDLDSLACEGFDIQGYAAFARRINPWMMLRKRLGEMRVTKRDGRLWYTPSIHKCGTVSARLTDNVLHVSPKHDPKVPGTELLGKIKAPDGYVFVYADWSQQEVMIFQSLCDQGVLGSSKYGETVLTGDLHVIVRDLMGFEKTKKGRSQAKPYTFLVQYGGGAAGCAGKLVASGLEESVANQIATQFISGYKGKATYSSSGTYYNGGIASAGYNALESMKRLSVMRTLLFNRAQSYPLERQYRGGGAEMTLGNWPIQSTGSDFLRGTFGLVNLLKGNLDIRPICSIHDMVCFIVPIADAEKGVAILQAAHLWLVSKFYANLGYTQIPENYGLFDSVEVDNRLRLNHLDPYVTPSNPDGFPVESCPM